MSDKRKTWREVLLVHPAAELTPLMTPEQLREHADDIKKNGLCEPVSIWDGDEHERVMSLLDGRNRLDALELLGVEIFHTKTKKGKEEINWHHEVDTGNGIGSPIFKIEYFVDDPYAFVKSKNLQRLHLSAEQRRDLLTKQLKANPEQSDRQIAAAVGVDHKTVAAVRREAEATGEIPQLKTTKGKDGKSRPARKKRQATAEIPQLETKIDDPAASAEARKAEYAAQEVATPTDEHTHLRARLPVVLQLPENILQSVVDHPADYTKAERVELIEALQRLADECIAWKAKLIASEPKSDEPDGMIDDPAKAGIPVFLQTQNRPPANPAEAQS